MNAGASSSHAHSALGSSGGHANARWKAGASSHSTINTYRAMILLEKKRKAHEAAASEMRNALLDETLASLRQKAHDLQDDQWLYDDVRI